ncbi:MAG: UbiX family flavin prenyltransferase [Deltaproteobacteria bacterium]|nr:UbiX family flavin prenyltransferase [Deltaproteobacteria bacterium]
MAGYIVALTGASGAIYGLRLVEELLKRGDDVDIVISPSGFLLLKEELGIDCAGGDVAGEISAFLSSRSAEISKGKLKYWPPDDLTAGFASGSALKRSMVICPCSMGTLARVASGISGNLIERAADCILKERGNLVLVPRETPLNTIHLENMLKLSRMNAVILPAMPAFYSKPRSIDDMVDFVVGKVLDVLGIENNLYKRWKK